MDKYDYLIVGAGLYGAIFAYEANKQGYKVLVIDKRKHIGGNLYMDIKHGIHIHKYGPHIFHTNNQKVWDYINQFTKFNNFINTPLAVYQDEVYNLPFNMNTFSKLWNIKTPNQAKEIIDKQIKENYTKEVTNLHQQALNLVGIDIYEKLIKGYTQKQWGKDCSDLPAFIINRIPLRFTYDNNYFNAKYQGIPIDGYNVIFDQLLQGIDVQLETDFFQDRNNLEKQANKIIYTGPIDQYYDYCLGALEYRSLTFKEETHNIDNFQGNAVINYTEEKIPYTRIIEHKHFMKIETMQTIITYEYPCSYNHHNEPYYPINNETNQELYQKYYSLTLKTPNVLFGGRLGSYQYYDMDKIIEKVLIDIEIELNNTL